MYRRSASALFGQGLSGGVKDTSFSSPKAYNSGDSWFSQLWFKPETRDERVKEYVPEVIEESIEEQRALMANQTVRDTLVEHGHKVLQAIENKAPTPSIAPSLNHILEAFGCEHIISQRALSYLLYPTTSAASSFMKGTGATGALPDLITAFPDNFRAMVEAIENDGSYVNRILEAKARLEEHQKKASTDSNTGSSQEAIEGKAEGEGESEAKPEVSAEGEGEAFESEPMEVTMFVKCVSAMSLANLHCNDVAGAVSCCDAALNHVIDQNRKGGVLGLKAGLLVREKEYEEAAKAGLLAVEASNNVQGYLHGATALRYLKRNEDARELLESGVDAFPQHSQMKEVLDTLTKESKPALEGEGTGGAEALENGQQEKVEALEEK